MSEPESRKYARKIGCVLGPIWMPLYFVAAIAGMLFGVIRKGFAEGVERWNDVLHSLHMRDQEDER